MLKHYDETRHVNYEEVWAYDVKTTPGKPFMVKTYKCTDCVGIKTPWEMMGL